MSVFSRPLVGNLPGLTDQNLLKERPTKHNRQEVNFTNPLRERSISIADHLSTPPCGLSVAQMIGSYSFDPHPKSNTLLGPALEGLKGPACVEH